MPDLLDGLAAHLVESRWSLKSLIHKIVTSDAYMQSAVVSDEAHEADPQNRYFARQNVRRLQAEAIMNTFAFLRDATRHRSRQARDKQLPNAQDFLGNFDGPSHDDLIDRRTVSISATQALFLMNSRSVHSNIAKGLTDRHRTKEHRGLASLLTPIYLENLGRRPTDADRAFAETLVTTRRSTKGNEKHISEINEIIHLLLCSNEFLYLE